MKINNYRAIDLLDKVIEFTQMTPDITEWNLSSLQSNPPRYIRLLQINSLMSAFFHDVTPNVTIDALLSGNFIKHRTINDYKETCKFIKDFIVEQGMAVDPTSEIHLDEMVFAYPFLIDFKRQSEKLLRFNSGWYASGETIRFSILLTNSISNNLADKLNVLNNALELFVNPKGLNFSEATLVKDYNYPLDDLDEIGLNFM